MYGVSKQRILWRSARSEISAAYVDGAKIKWRNKRRINGENIKARIRKASVATHGGMAVSRRK